MSKKYYLGLDIGTNSVGWAVTDENYNLCKYAGKRMWGIRLFEGGETAEQRRISRSNRRRLSRKKQRIDLLQELFAEEIAKMDPTFFIRLNESRLHLEDKSTGEKFPLFTDKDYTDIQYYKEYPTIYHLRKELIENSKVHDVRLVYLACHHILKNRGHFLINGSFSDVKKLSSVCESMLNSFNGISKYQLEINDIERLEEILSDRKKQKSVKAKELIQIFECGPCEDKTDEKTCKAIVSNLCKWLTGLKGNINSIFDMQFEEIDTSSFSFTEPKYEDTISAALEEKYPDYADVIQKIKAVYDWSVLVEIMAGEDYLSFAKVNAYNKHKENLCILKEVIRKYCDSEMYHKFFNGFDEKNGYGNYIGSIYKNGHSYAMKKCSTEDFYKTLGKILDKIQPEKEDENILEELKIEVKNQTLLPLARTTANGTIPNQVHIQELKAILDNAKKYCAPDLKYCIVPEFHSDKEKYHFHALMSNLGNIQLIDSGRRKDRGTKIIYNIANYRLGFSTAIPVSKDSTSQGKIVGYMLKYITKDLLTLTQGKKRYWYTRNTCEKPVIDTFLVESDKLQDFTEALENDKSYRKSIDMPFSNNELKIYNFDTN